MRTRLTGFIALVALLFSGLFAVAGNAGAQEQQPEPEPQEDKDETVLVCKQEGLDWNLWEMTPEEADYWLANGALPGHNGCLVRVCVAQSGHYYEFWGTDYLTAGDAEWVVSNYNAYKAERGVPCPGNEDVSICVPQDGAWKLVTMDMQGADWLLYTGEGRLPENGECKEPEPEPTPEPTPEQPTPEPTPEEQPTPEETPEEQPTPEETPEEEPEEETAPPKDDGKTKEKGEALGKQESNELAVTGTESSDLALYGGLLLVAGTALMGASRLRVRKLEV